jgi:hypothetical protein
MSISKTKIINKLLNIAQSSKLNQKHAAAICCGSKILCSSVNTNRTKFGKNIYPCGHSEANCIINYFQLKDRTKRASVLASLREKPKS